MRAASVARAPRWLHGGSNPCAQCSIANIRTAANLPVGHLHQVVDTLEARS
jgi:hypothetical protein